MYKIQSGNRHGYGLLPAFGHQSVAIVTAAAPVQISSLGDSRLRRKNAKNVVAE